MDRLLTDLRYACRALKASPGLAAVAVLSLAIGVGPNAVIFSLADALGFRPLAVRDPGSLLQITSVTAGRSGELSYPDFRDIRARARLLQDCVISARQMFNVLGEGRQPEVVVGAAVSGDYFAKLGVSPKLGRGFLPEEDRTPGSHMVAMISERFWKRRFDADPAVIGKPIRLTKHICTIVGVVPAGFAGTRPILAPDVWVPTMAWPLFDSGVEGTLEARNRREHTVLARLAPGASLDQASAELEALAGSLGEGSGPKGPPPKFVVEHEQAARRRPVAILTLLSLAVVSLVLLVACANVAGLLIGRAEGRTREIALRLAFGASRRRLVRQLLTESVLLAVLAAGAGTALAWGMIRTLPGLIPPTGLPLTFDFRVDFRVLAFTLGVTLFTVPFFGLAPALLASRADLLPLIKGGAPTPGRARLPLRRALVITQIAIAVVLLVSSGFLLQSLVRAQQIDPGFARRPMVFTTVAPGGVGYSEAQSREYYRTLLDRVGGLPMVERATLVRHLPLNNLYGGGSPARVVVPGRETRGGVEPTGIRFNTLAAGFFETMGTPLLRGRDFGSADVKGGTRVAIINETMARKFWRNEEAIGRQFHILGPGEPASRTAVLVVGVAKDAKYFSLTEAPAPYFYVPISQHPGGEVTLVARFTGDAREMVQRLRRELLSVDPAVPILQVLTIDDHLRLSVAVERMVATTVGVVGSLGLGLSLVGLYGVISFLVARRTREIGIRMALGARPAAVVGQVLEDAARLALIGIGIGLAASVGVMQVAASSIYGIDPSDPLVFAATAALVMAVALTASWIPARHAARVDPQAALRAE